MVLAPTEDLLEVMAMPRPRLIPLRRSAIFHYDAMVQEEAAAKARNDRRTARNISALEAEKEAAKEAEKAAVEAWDAPEADWGDATDFADGWLDPTEEAKEESKGEARDGTDGDDFFAPTAPPAVLGDGFNLLPECHYNLALILHEEKKLEEAAAAYRLAIAAREASGGGLFVDAKYNLKIAENQLKSVARAAKSREKHSSKNAKKETKRAKKDARKEAEKTGKTGKAWRRGRRTEERGKSDDDETDDGRKRRRRRRRTEAAAKPGANAAGSRKAGKGSGKRSVGGTSGSEWELSERASEWEVEGSDSDGSANNGGTRAEGKADRRSAGSGGSQSGGRSGSSRSESRSGSESDDGADSSALSSGSASSPSSSSSSSSSSSDGGSSDGLKDLFDSDDEDWYAAAIAARQKAGGATGQGTARQQASALRGVQPAGHKQATHRGALQRTDSEMSAVSADSTMDSEVNDFDTSDGGSLDDGAAAEVGRRGRLEAESRHQQRRQRLSDEEKASNGESSGDGDEDRTGRGGERRQETHAAGVRAPQQPTPTPKEARKGRLPPSPDAELARDVQRSRSPEHSAAAAPPAAFAPAAPAAPAVSAAVAAAIRKKAGVGADDLAAWLKEEERRSREPESCAESAVHCPGRAAAAVSDGCLTVCDAAAGIAVACGRAGQWAATCGCGGGEKTRLREARLRRYREEAGAADDSSHGTDGAAHGAALSSHGLHASGGIEMMAMDRSTAMDRLAAAESGTAFAPTPAHTPPRQGPLRGTGEGPDSSEDSEGSGSSEDSRSTDGSWSGNSDDEAGSSNGRGDRVKEAVSNFGRRAVATAATRAATRADTRAATRADVRRGPQERPSDSEASGGSKSGTGGKGGKGGKGAALIRPDSPDIREGSTDSAASDGGGGTQTGVGVFAGTVGLPVGRAIAKAQAKTRALHGAKSRTGEKSGPGKTGKGPKGAAAFDEEDIDFTL